MLTHWMTATVELSSWAKVCRATLTIVVSKMTAMPPTTSTSAVIRTLRSILSDAVDIQLSISLKIRTCI